MAKTELIKDLTKLTGEALIGEICEHNGKLPIDVLADIVVLKSICEDCLTISEGAIELDRFKKRCGFKEES